LSNPSVNKRLKERNRQDKQKEKEAKREQRKQDKSQRPSTANGEDPDIAGIIPGPQPIPDEQSA
jgi:hypothetical protein